MPLTRKDRFRLKSQLVDELAGDSWTFDRINLLLAEFGVETLSADWHGPSVADVIGSVPDSALVELCAVAFDLETDEVEDLVDSVEVGLWQPGYVRLFLSHSARHKQYVGDVSRELAVIGVHGFVAHDTLEYSRPWQTQIEQALRSMQAFCVVVHADLNKSPWCHQEVGWALGRRVPFFAVRMDADPDGFPGSDQWPSGSGRTPKQVAGQISAWITSVPEFGQHLVDGLLSALEGVGNYIDAGAAVERLAELGSLSNEDFARLDRIWWSNDQLHGGVLATKAMKPFYVSNNRQWPPPKPAAAIDPPAGWDPAVEPF